MISVKIGFRNLARNRWRSGLTLGGIAISVAFMVWILGFMEGWLATMVQGATAVETAQVQIHTVGFADNPRVYRSFPVDPQMFETLAGVEGVVAFSPRLKLNGLIGHEEKSQVGRIFGVDPVREVETTPVADGIVEGRWLSTEPAEFPGGGVVSLAGVDAETGRVLLTVRTPDMPAMPEVLAVEVSTKPLINLVWFGMAIMLTGTLLAIFRRTRGPGSLPSSG